MSQIFDAKLRFFPVPAYPRRVKGRLKTLIGTHGDTVPNANYIYIKTYQRLFLKNLTGIVDSIVVAGYFSWFVEKLGNPPYGGVAKSSMAENDAIRYKL